MSEGHIRRHLICLPTTSVVTVITSWVSRVIYSSLTWAVPVILQDHEGKDQIPKSDLKPLSSPAHLSPLLSPLFPQPLPSLNPHITAHL